MDTKKIVVIFIALSIAVLPGCATLKKASEADMLRMENKDLRAMIQKLRKEKDAQIESLRSQKDEEIGKTVEVKDRELQDLHNAMKILEEQLKKEIGEYKARLQMTERGLVITFLAEIFFDSGKDVMRKEGKESLGKVAEVLNKNVPDSSIAVEGHTDSDPIKYSGWRSNWELSSARALAVVHYLISKGKVRPQRLSAVGYGEYRPVAPNETVKAKQQNRRVEIIILPSKVKKVKGE